MISLFFYFLSIRNFVQSIVRWNLILRSLEICRFNLFYYQQDIGINEVFINKKYLIFSMEIEITRIERIFHLE